MEAKGTGRIAVVDRIGENRRSTNLLLLAFGSTLLPVLAALSVGAAVLSIPVLMPAFLSVEAAPRLLLSVPVGVGVLTACLLAPLAVYAGYRRAAAVALRIARAGPLPAEEDARLRNVAEELCLGLGLPLPALRLVASPIPNAFAVGLDPPGSTLVVTRGLLDLLDRHELQGVLAHELCHVRNGDARLGTAAGAFASLLALPWHLVSAPFRALFRVHWVLGAGSLLVLARLLTFGGISLDDPGGPPPGDPLRVIRWAATGMTAYVLLVAPSIGHLLRRALVRQREMLADAEAARLTGNPAALARALGRIAASAAPRKAAPFPLAHLLIVGSAAGPPRWIARFLSFHPPVEERIRLLSAMADGPFPSPRPGGEAAGIPPGPPGPPPGAGPLAGPVTGDTDAPASLPDAFLAGAAAGMAAFAILTVLYAAALVLLGGRGPAAPPLLAAPFNLPAALAAWTAARRGGATVAGGTCAAVPVFLFSWLLLAPMLGILPGAGASPLRWTAWNLLGGVWLVTAGALLGAAAGGSGGLRRKAREWREALLDFFAGD